MRLAVVVDQPTPVWAGELLEAFASMPEAEVAALIVAQGRPHRPSAVHLFGRLDRRLFANPADDPFRPWAGSLPATVVRLDARDPALVAALTAVAPDVVIQLGDGPPPRALLDLGAEVWWFDRGGTAPYLADLAHGDPVSTTVLMARRADHPADVVLGRSRTRADPGSWHRTRATAYRQSAELAVKSVRNMEQHPLAAQGREADGSWRRVPALRLPSISARAIRRRIEWQRNEEQWVLAVRARRRDALCPSDTAGFVPIAPPPGTSWADPFLAVGDQGERYVFFEDQPHDTRKAGIACAEIGVDGLQGEPCTVLERGYHLSYPFVFKRGDDWFLLPETSANRTLELYRARRFPLEWELARVLLEDVYLLDATPFEHEGRTWIFASSETATGHPADAVSLYWAESLAGEWHPHPLNPVVTDIRASRPAGRVMSRGGRLIRPAQDGSRGYGSALVFNEITRLTTTAYEERPLGRLSPDWLDASDGMHHYEADELVEIVDARRRVPRRRRPGGA